MSRAIRLGRSDIYMTILLFKTFGGPLDYELDKERNYAWWLAIAANGKGLTINHRVDIPKINHIKEGR